MLKNYVILALRNLLKRKAYSFINIFGLAIGVAACLILLKYVDFHLSFENYHQNSGDLYRMISTTYRNNENTGTGVLTGYALGPRMKDDLPEVKRYIRVHPAYGAAVVGNPEVESLTFHEEDILFVDSTFLDAFTYKAAEGNLATALDNPSSIVLTRSTAAKYFGDSHDAVGKTVSVNAGWLDADFTVSAVVDDVPGNSHLTFKFLIPLYKLLETPQYTNDNGWGWQNFLTYVQLHPGIDQANVENKLPAFVETHRGEELRKNGTQVEFDLQPIEEIHTNPGLELEMSATISMTTIYFFLLIAIFILAIAWVNYINLATARAMERAREVGIKKAVGAMRGQLIVQFLFESMAVNLLAIALALVLAYAFIPVLAGIVGQDLSFDLRDPHLWMVMAGLFVVGSLVSGAYPAFILSSFKTSIVLKGAAEKIGGGFSLRETLVVFQFVSSLVLIAGTFAVYRQIMFMRNQDKGLTMDQMLIVKGPLVFEGEAGPAIVERLTTFKNELRSIPSVDKVASSSTIPGGGFNWGTGMRKEGDPVEAVKSGNVTWVDTDFVDTYGIEVVAGRTWNPDIASDFERTLANEEALVQLGLGTPEEALEKGILLGNDTIRILGVLKNYHWSSLKTAHGPILLAPTKISRGHFSIHLTSVKNIQETVSAVKERFTEAFPGNPFEYYFLDEFFDRQYREEKQFAQVFGLFAGLAIGIACLGLWGLAAFTTTQKLKEISIRRVLGASTLCLLSLLAGQFMKLVLIAAVVSLPLTWYGVDQWLSTFPYRVGVGWDIFVIPTAVLAFIALLTVGFQIVKGARANPAAVLRSE